MVHVEDQKNCQMKRKITNFVALQGGKIKRDQMLSGTMADIFGNLYMAISVKYCNDSISPLLSDYIIKRILCENQTKMNQVIDNLGMEHILLQHLKSNEKPIMFDKQRSILKEIMENNKIIEKISENIYIKDNTLSRLKCAVETHDDKMKSHVIQVGEYKNK